MKKKFRYSNPPQRGDHGPPINHDADAQHLTLSFDGSCWPNPGGPAKCGWVIGGIAANLDLFDVAEGSRQCDDAYTTNNVAEFRGLEDALKWLVANPRKIARLVIVGDSMLTINALDFGWKMPNSPHLAAIMQSIRGLLDQLGCAWSARWVPRGLNEKADSLTR